MCISSMLCGVSLFLYSPELAVVPLYLSLLPGSLDCRQMSPVHDKGCRGLQIVGRGIRL